MPRSDRDSILKMAKGVLIVRQGHAILERPTYTQVQGLSIDSFSVKSIPKAQFVSFEKKSNDLYDYNAFAGTIGG